MNTMANQHVDVVANLVDSPITVVKTAEQRHIFAIGYHSAKAAKFAPKYWLSGVDFNWGPMFVQMAKQVMTGEWKAKELGRAGEHGHRPARSVRPAGAAEGKHGRAQRRAHRSPRTRS